MRKSVYFAVFAFTVLFSILVINPNESSAQTPRLNYQFEETSGQAVLDSTANLLHGTLGATNQTESSDPTRDSGAIGQGLLLDGVDDFVSAPTDASLNDLTNFSLEAWIYPTSYFDTAGRLSEIFNKGNDQKRFFIDSAAGTLGGIVKHATKSAATYTGTPIPLNQWSHVMMVYSSTTKKISIYVNGVVSLSATKDAGTGSLSTDSTTPQTNWVVGSQGGTNAFLNGKVDGVKIYNTALTAKQALAQYNSALSNDILPPTVSVTSPYDSFVVKGIKILTASASDDFGIAGVQFKIDGANYGSEDLTFPYSVNFDSTTFTNASHTIEAVARDKTNKTSISDPVNITVDNSGVNTRDNIVIIVTDDQRWDTMQYMPLTTALFSNETTKFNNATVADPVCCPSRVSMFTGLYAHNHKVMTNGLGTHFDDTSSLATWAEKEGYRTGLIGKYLTAYPSKFFQYVPRGWSDWRAFAKKGSLYHNYTLNENGALVAYGTGDVNYSTNQLATKAVSFINSTPASQPLLLYFTPSAPHAPATPASVDAGTYAGIAPWRPVSYNEADVSDKPVWAKKLPFMTPTIQSSTDILRRNQLEALQAVDRAVADIFNALTTTGRIDSTVVIFTSDNGKVWGEHRWSDKECVWEECIHVPLWIKMPGTTNSTNNDLVQNIDLVPTITDITGITPGFQADGRSLKDILLQTQTGPLRGEMLIEFGGVKDNPGDRQVIETAFSAVRDNQYVYAEYTNGDREFYDLSIDPYQMTNMVNDPAYATVISNLQNKLLNLKSL